MELHAPLPWLLDRSAGWIPMNFAENVTSSIPYAKLYLLGMLFNMSWWNLIVATSDAGDISCAHFTLDVYLQLLLALQSIYYAYQEGSIWDCEFFYPVCSTE